MAGDGRMAGEGRGWLGWLIIAHCSTHRRLISRFGKLQARSRCIPIHGLAVDIFECLKKDAFLLVMSYNSGHRLAVAL